MNAGTDRNRAATLLEELGSVAESNMQYETALRELRAGEAEESFPFRLLTAQLDRLHEVGRRLDAVEEILRDIVDRVEVIDRAYRGEFA